MDARRPITVESTAAELAALPEAEVAAAVSRMAALLAPMLGRARVVPLPPAESERAA